MAGGRQAATQFKPGHSGNPGGKPANARNRVTRKFLEALADDFEENGAQAIKDAREADPLGYSRMVASLLPKEFVIDRPTDGLTDDELAAAIAELRARIGSLEDPGNGTDQTEEPQPSRGVPTIQ